MAVGERVLEARMAANWQRPVVFLLKIIGVVLFLVLVPVAFKMEWSDFRPLFNPLTIRFLFFGLVDTVAVSLVAIIASLPLATGLALGRLSHISVIRWPCIVFVEVIRALPLLLLIFYVNLRFPGLDVFAGLRLGASGDYLAIEMERLLSRGALALTIALTLYTAAVNAELLRSGILSLERGQFEAARSLGLSYWQMMRLVILPQAFRRTLAPLIAQFTILVKDTSLGSIIGFLELQRRAVIHYQNNFNPMEALYVVALIYFVVNFMLGLVSKLIERKGPSVEVRPTEL
jgi:His/Glu/Gln/Arg/opine family amino acid ABC transporter permease subunit